MVMGASFCHPIRLLVVSRAGQEMFTACRIPCERSISISIDIVSVFLFVLGIFDGKQKKYVSVKKVVLLELSWINVRPEIKGILRCLQRLGQNPLYPSASHVPLAMSIFIWDTVADIIFQSEIPPAQQE